MSTPTKNAKRKKNKKYFQPNKKYKSGCLETGLKGFLITSNNEKQCVKESYNILNDFADDLFGTELKSAKGTSGSKELDIEEELAQEIKDIKTNKRRFQQVNTLVKGSIFISTTVPDPTNLATSIFDNVLQTGKRRTRFILKMIPIVITCKASQNDIRRNFDEYLQEFLKDETNKKLSYKTICKIRFNGNITNSHVLWYIRESIEKYASDWTVSLNEPEVAISVSILRSICCIGVLKNFMAYRKYNLSETAITSEKDLDEDNADGKFAKPEASVTAQVNSTKSEICSKSRKVINLSEAITAREEDTDRNNSPKEIVEKPASTDVQENSAESEICSKSSKAIILSEASTAREKQTDKNSSQESSAIQSLPTVSEIPS